MDYTLKNARIITYTICLVLSAYTLITIPDQWAALAATMGWLAALDFPLTKSVIT